MNPLFKSSLLAALAIGSLPTAAQVSLDFDAAKRGPMTSPLQYGIFYEEINNAGDGGLYAELIRNRCFEDASQPDHWSALGGAQLSLTRSGLMNENRRAALNVKLSGADQGLSNSGYWGIQCAPGDSFNLTVWLKSDAGYSGTVTARITDNLGNKGAMGETSVSLSGKWQKIIIPMASAADAPFIKNGKFDLRFGTSGSLTLGMVSLFPKTYKDRENGCRIDLAEMLEGLHPKFVRFPGGCYIEGSGSDVEPNRFEWKKTIGPIEQRPGHYNFNWGYPSTDGLGFHEFLQLTEDLGAEPLFVANIGLGHGWHIDYTKIDSFIQEALDAIEYCNGGADTFWGAKRIENGHPEPFNLRLLEIGNENYNYDDELSDHYAERYKAFYDAIKSKYPEITLIGNTEAWGTDNPSWRNSYPVEMVDEHYYRTPQWFESNYNKYDSYPRSGPQIYPGEYAVTDGFGTNGHLRAALGEAVYMLGMERNSDIVAMASYAPIFYNEERNGGWLPDMIRFTHNTAYGTPSYYVQKMLPEALGKQNLIWTEEGNLIGGGQNKVGVSSWSTTVSYDNVKVTDPNGNVLFSDDFSGDASQWSLPSSSWSVSDGKLTQKSGSENGAIAYSKTVLPSSYVLELDAVKNSGAEGFLVAVNVADRDNYIWWNIGGWGNGQHGVQVCKGGAKSDYDLKAGSVETGRTYHIRMEVDGTHLKCYLDSELIHDLYLPVDRNIYVSSQIDDDAQLMYVKLVNTHNNTVSVKLGIDNATVDGTETLVLTSPSASDENTLADTEKVVPVSGASPTEADGKLIYWAPANSLSVITVRLSDIKYDPKKGHNATTSQMASFYSEINPIAAKLAWLHQSSSLPVMTDSGTHIEWTPGEGALGFSVTSNRHSAQIEITTPNNSDSNRDAGFIVAKASFADGAVAEVPVPVRFAPADDAYGYLYTYMNSGKEITNYALGSKEGSGKQFSQLADGAEIFDTQSLASIEGGTRDAFLGRGERGQEYFMTATDMCVAKSGRWNNYGMDLLRSNDLIHWESTVFDFREGKKIFSDPDATTDAYKTDAEYAKIDRVWAPQFIWDPSADHGKGLYLVYYSLLSSNPGDAYDKIYYSYADRDFKTLTQPRLMFDAGVSVIDADIVFNEYDSLYHILLKRSGTTASTTGIYEYTSPAIIGSEWKEIGRVENQNTTSIEAPTRIRRIGEDVYNFYFMRYDGEYSYKVADMDPIAEKAGLPVRLAGDGAFQHGSMIYVDKDEYDMLSIWSDVTILLRQAKQLKASSGTNAFDEAIAYADKALAENRSISSLLEALPAAYDMLVKANGVYMGGGSKDFSDISHLLVNTTFDSDNASGWSGTPFTAAAGGVAEHFNRNFDTYQTLKAMPAGTYRLEAQGFYRYGLPVMAQPAHADGSELLFAKLYINDSESSFMSLYDEQYSSYPNDVWSANRAFNTDHKYQDNVVEFILSEPGEVRVGIRKSSWIDGDWTCFDNFKLFYSTKTDAVESIDSNDESKSVNVYSADGILIREGVDSTEATEGLTPGLYIVGSSKVIVD